MGVFHMSDLKCITESLLTLLNERFALTEEITPDTDLLATGALESLTIMDLLAHIDQEYEVCFMPEEIVPANFQSVGRLAELISAKQPQFAAA